MLAWGIASTAGSYKHPLEAWAWLFQVSVIPCTFSTLYFSLISASAKVDRVLFHFAAIIAAFVAVAFAGSVGVFVVARLHGDTPNISKYFGWCWIYATALLPLTYPVAVILQLMIRQLHRMFDGDESC